MDERAPDVDGGSPSAGFRPGVHAALSQALAGATRALYLTEAARIQTVLLLWDAMVADETERRLTVAPSGKAERAFTGHLAGLLRVSNTRAATVLHHALTARGLPVSFGLLQAGAFGWAAMECITRNLGALSGDARQRYDLEAARIAAEEVPQLLEHGLSRLHDQLDHDEATETAARAHRERRVRARPGPLGAATLTVTGPQTDIAALWETGHRLAVAAHGLPGETRTMDQLRYDCTIDVLLHGYATTPTDLAREHAGMHLSAGDGVREGVPAGDDPRTPSTPFERLGDPRVPGRKAITAEIIVTIPAATAAGLTNAPGRLLGWGPLPAAESRRLVASTRCWTRAEIDPVDDAILGFDSHTRVIPAALRRLIWLRADTCDEPGCTASAHLADIDHVVRVEHGGRTVELNLTALCRSSHQTKDDGYVDVEHTPHGLDWHTTRWGGRKTKKPKITLRRPPTPDTNTDEPAPWDTAA